MITSSFDHCIDSKVLIMIDKSYLFNKVKNKEIRIKMKLYFKVFFMFIFI